MYRQLANLLSTKTQTANKNSYRRANLAVEALEERALMSSAPIIFSTLDESRGDFGNTTTAAKTVKLAPVMETQVTGSLATSTDTDMFKVDLTAGQVFTASADGSGRLIPRVGIPRVKVTLLNASSTALADNGAQGDSMLAYRVQTGGTYFVKLTETIAAPTAMNYTLHLRSIGLDNTILNDQILNTATGGMYAWLNGDKLNISGPVGHGFSIRGNWQEATSRSGNLISANYQATGDVYLQTPNGEVALHIPGGGAFTVSTLPQVAGDLFGEINAINWNAAVSLPDLATTFKANLPFGFDLEKQALQVNLGTSLTNPTGVKLGRETILQQTGAPVFAAVPYLYFTVNPLGGNTGGGLTNVLSIVVDPSDPMLFIGSGLAGIPLPFLPNVSINAIGYSQHGLLPYQPIAQPSQWSGSFSGHFFIDASVKFIAAGIPMEVEGNLNLDLDPKNSGRLLGGAQVSTDQLVKYLTDPTSSALNASTVDTIFSNLAVGLNGTLKLGVFDKLFHNLFGNSFVGNHAPKLAVGQASLIYDGPSHSGYFHGGTVNPLAGTPLAILGSQYTLDVDAAIKGNGSVYVDVQGNYVIAGLPAHGHIRFLNNYSQGTHSVGSSGSLFANPNPLTGIYIDQSVSVLGNSLDLTGSVLGNGDFTLTGSANVNLGNLGGSATFILKNTAAQGFSFTAGLHGNYSSSVVKADVDANLVMTVSNSHLNYAGSGTAKVKVKTPFGWNTIGSVSVGIDTHSLWFKAAGNKYTVSLPG